MNCADEYRNNIAEDFSATQKASVNVTSKLKLMQTGAIEFMRAMNSSGLASAMLMNMGRKLQRNEGVILMHLLLKIR